MKTKILDITLYAEQNGQIPVSVMVQNIHTASLRVMIDGSVQYGPAPYPGVSFEGPGGSYEGLLMASGQTATIHGTFHVPPQNAVLVVRSRHYANGHWNNFDDEKEVDVIVEEEPTLPTEIIDVLSPTTATYEENIEVKVIVRNPNAKSLSVRVEGHAHAEELGGGPTLDFGSPITIPAGGTRTFTGTFSMPRYDVIVTVRSAHYEHGHWFNWGGEESWAIKYNTGHSRMTNFKVTPYKTRYDPGEVVTFSGRIEVSEMPGVIPWRGLSNAPIHLIANQVILSSASSNQHGDFSFVTQLPHSNRTDNYKARYDGSFWWRGCESSVLSITTYSDPGNGNGSPPPPPPPPPPNGEDPDWEKYLKWGLIGGGVLLGISILVPGVIRRTRR